MEAPFIFGKLAEGKHFINRDEDLENLKLNLKSGINTILISPRRWGKSSLVKKASEQLKSENPELHFCFIDLFNIRSEEAFYEDFATKLIRVTSTKWEEWIKNGKKFFQVVSEAARKKPIILLKSGRSSFGAKAASSHTGALAGSDIAVELAFKKTGVIFIRTFYVFMKIAFFKHFLMF